jgi:hypothetical protein
MKKIVDADVFSNYFLVGSLVAVSGFPFFMTAQINFLILFVIASFFYFKKSLQPNPKILWIIIPFVVVEVLQFLFIKPFDPIMITGTFIRMFLGFFIVTLAGKNFIRYFTNIIVFFSVISFFFFIPSLLSSSFFNFFKNSICPYFVSPFADTEGFYTVWPTNIIFCFHDCVLEEFRNPGPFWEPGLFAVFLNLALLFNLILEKKLFSIKNGILILALLSTLSTAGYIAFFMLVFFFFQSNQSFLRRLLLALFILPVILTLYFSLDFLSTKVEQNISLAGTTTSSRFGSAAVDLADFMSSPFIGWGRGVMRYGGRPFAFFSEEQHRNNSVTDLLATYGIFIFVLYFANYYLTLKAICKDNNFNLNFAFLALVVILALGFSQSIFMKPVFYSILFIQFNYLKKQPDENFH